MRLGPYETAGPARTVHPLLELHCWEFDLQGPEINQRASSLEGFCWLANPALLGHPTPQATPLLLEMGNKAMPVGDKVWAGGGVGAGNGEGRA